VHRQPGDMRFRDLYRAGYPKGARGDQRGENGQRENPRNDKGIDHTINDLSNLSNTIPPSALHLA
jgi:hypothetical protein